VTSGSKPLDFLANKNIVYCAKNALVAIAYTGFAFLGDVPTDQWLVEQLIGTPFDRNQSLPAIAMGHFRPPIDIGLSMQLLKEKLDLAWADAIPEKWRTQWNDASFILLVQGWQWSRRNERPILEWISKEPGETSVEIGRRPRYWFWERSRISDGTRGIRFSVGAAPPGHLSSSALQEVVAQLQDCPHDSAEAILVRAIRMVSSQVREVGPHCMSILIAPPSIGQARIRFLPATPHEVFLATSTARMPLTAFYAPWLVSSDFIGAPSVLTGPGQTTVPLGRYQVHIEVDSAAAGPSIHTSQKRPRPPHP
jgi:hypothetical protein